MCSLDRFFLHVQSIFIHLAQESVKNQLSNATDSGSELAVTANSRSRSSSNQQHDLVKEGPVDREQKPQALLPAAEEDEAKREEGEVEVEQNEPENKNTRSYRRHQRRRSRNRRPSFGLKPKRKTKSSSLTPTSSHLARIPQLASGFVLDLLPGLHFLLDTGLAPLAVRALIAISSRANLELWADVGFDFIVVQWLEYTCYV